MNGSKFTFPTEQLPDGCIAVAGTGQSERINALIGLLLTIVAPKGEWCSIPIKDAACFLKSDRCRQIYISNETELKQLLVCLAKEGVLSLTDDKIVINVPRMESILYFAKMSWYRL